MNYNICFDISGIIILITLEIILKTLYAMTSRSNRLFRRFIHLCISAGLLDLLTAFTIEHAVLIPEVLNMILNTVYLYTAFIASYSGMLYVFSTVNFKSRKNKICDISVIIFYTVLLLVNFFTGLVFDFSGQKYNHGPMFHVTYIVSFYFILHMALILLLKRKSFSKKQLALFSSFIIFPLFFSLIQVFLPSILLTVFAASTAALLMLFALETPDFAELVYLRKNLENEVERQTAKAMEKQKQIEKMSLEIVEALVQAIDAKDDYTRGHSVRVSRYSVLIAKALGWDDEKIKNLRIAALLHDIGKIGIHDDILNKPDLLTEEEFSTIMQHTEIGSEILDKVTSIPYAASVAKSHHERIDGNGYPEKLAGNEIPEFARIVNIADSYDAMSTDRTYRKKLPRQEIRRRLIECRGTQFDPEYIDIFIELIDNNTAR